MSATAKLWINEVMIEESERNILDVGIASIFRKEDKISIESANENIPSQMLYCKEFLEEDPELSLGYYKAPLHIIRDRLEATGYDLETCRQAALCWEKEEYSGCWDRLIYLRLDIENFGDSAVIIYDISELILGEYTNYYDDFLGYENDKYKDENLLYAKNIILTEGKTDRFILEETFNLLYPHLSEYYSFLNFNDTRYAGGSGNLLNLVKAFAGIGSSDNIIALFDNDTAGEDALQQLKKLDLPKNIKVMKLPDLEILKSYPTIETTGLTTSTDINGMAASIELYTGKDILLQDNGNLTPIQWTGYNIKLNKYQGKILYKDKLHDRFNQKINSAKKGTNFEWEEIKLIFSTIFKLFQEEKRKIICERAKKYYS